MTERDLKCASHKAGKLAWWYEEPWGISVVSDLLGNDQHLLGTTITKIQWAAIRAALARLDKPAKKKRKGARAT